MWCGEPDTRRGEAAGICQLLSKNTPACVWQSAKSRLRARSSFKIWPLVSPHRRRLTPSIVVPKLSLAFSLSLSPSASFPPVGGFLFQRYFLWWGCFDTGLKVSPGGPGCAKIPHKRVQSNCVRTAVCTWNVNHRTAVGSVNLIKNLMWCWGNHKEDLFSNWGRGHSRGR